MTEKKETELSGPAATPGEEEPPDALDLIRGGALKELDPRSVDAERTVGWIVTAVTSLGLGGALLLGSLLGWLPGWTLYPLLAVWVSIVVALCWLSSVYPKLQFDHTRYRVTPLGMEIQKGVWWRHGISVPRSRVQHTDVLQGPFMRRFGIAKLIIHTAGTESSTVELEGLSHQVAHEIRDFLIRGRESDGV